MNAQTKEPIQADSTGEEKGGTPSRTNEYFFEDTAGTVRTRGRADEYLKRFVKRLHLKLDDDPKKTANPDLLDLLREYVYENQLAIEWYDGKREEEISEREKFRKGSIGLLIGLPIIVAVIAFLLGKFGSDTSGSAITAVITAVLTGLLGIQRAIGTWMDQRQLVGIFWQASADLKENVYTLEGNWEDRGLDGSKPDQQFIADLEAGIAAARKIARTERDAYFATFKAKSLDVGAMLKSASAEASALWSGFAADTIQEEMKRVEQAESAQESLMAKRQRVRRLRSEVAKLKSFIDPDLAGDDAAKKEFQKQLVKKQIELVTAEAAIGG